MTKIPERFYTKTVYGLRLPEFNIAVRDLQLTDKFLKRHEKPWLKYQDEYHEQFASDYSDWMYPQLQKDLFLEFNYFYPSNGSSEAIKDVLMTFKTNTPNGSLHVFSGEYEGYQAYAKALNINVVTHFKNNYDVTLPRNSVDGDLFMISQPSGIDGMLWSGFGDFMETAKVKLNLKVAVDLAYAPMSYTNIYLKYKHIEQADYVFVSLSKSFGVYYNRIGGVFSKEEIPLLYGNQWFKNIDSLLIGCELMDKFKLDKIKELFDHHVSDARFGFYDIFHSKYELSQTDVPIIATSGRIDEYPELVRGDSFPRLCISPYIQESIERQALK